MKLLTLIAFIILMFFSCQSNSEKSHSPVSVVSHPFWSKGKIISKMDVESATEEGTYKAFKNKLVNLKERGPGILLINPVSPENYNKVNSRFGSEKDFIQMVNEIHRQNIYVIIDWNAAQCALKNNIVISKPAFFKKLSSEDTDKNLVVKFDYSNPEMQAFMINIMKYWVEYFNVDGFHCKNADDVPVEFWDDIRQRLEELRPVFMLAESEAAFMHNKAFDMTYGFNTYIALNNILKKSSPAYHLNDVLNRERSVFPTSAMRLRFWPALLTDDNKYALNPFAVFCFTAPGTPLIDDAPLNDFYQKLINLYRTSEAIKTGKMITVTNEKEEKVFAFIRESSGEKILIVLNLSSGQIPIDLESELISGEYRELFSNVPVSITDTYHFDLEPWAYRVFIEQN